MLRLCVGLHINQILSAHIQYIVALSTFESHKNPAYFSDPERFWPERWMGQEIDPATGNRLKCDDAYIPFGIGKRMCAGKHLAQSMIKLLLTKVHNNYYHTFHLIL